MATIIDPESAKSLIKEYQQQNSATGGPAIKTPEGHFLHGYFLDRQSLEAILKDPEVAGVSLHLAKHPAFKGADTHHFTVLYAGAQPNNDPKPLTPYVNKGVIYGEPPPCPPMCSNLVS